MTTSRILLPLSSYGDFQESNSDSNRRYNSRFNQPDFTYSTFLPSPEIIIDVLRSDTSKLSRHIDSGIEASLLCLSGMYGITLRLTSSTKFELSFKANGERVNANVAIYGTYNEDIFKRVAAIEKLIYEGNQINVNDIYIVAPSPNKKILLENAYREASFNILPTHPDYMRVMDPNAVALHNMVDNFLGESNNVVANSIRGLLHFGINSMPIINNNQNSPTSREEERPDFQPR